MPSNPCYNACDGTLLEINLRTQCEANNSFYVKLARIAIISMVHKGIKRLFEGCVFFFSQGLNVYWIPFLFVFFFLVLTWLIWEFILILKIFPSEARKNFQNLKRHTEIEKDICENGITQNLKILNLLGASSKIPIFGKIWSQNSIENLQPKNFCL